MGDAHDAVETSAGAEIEQTPQKNHVEAHFKPATRPPTNRATRSKKATPADESPTNGLTTGMETVDSSFDSTTSATAGKKGKKGSPFDSWPRGKPGKKRAGEELEGAGKRSRGDVDGPA